jgi:hypothetical protein
MRRKRKTETLEGLCQFIDWRRKGLEVSLSLSCLSCGLAGVRDVIRRFVTSFDDLDKGFFSFHLSAREPKVWRAQDWKLLRFAFSSKQGWKISNSSKMCTLKRSEKKTIEIKKKIIL